LGSLALDVSTLIFILSVGNLVLGAAILAHRRIPLLERSARLFLAAKFIQSVGWLLLWLRGLIPGFYSIIVGNGLLMAGISFECYSIGTVERGDPLQRGLYSAYAAAGILLLMVFPDSPPARIIVVTSAYIAVYLSLSFFMLRRNRTTLRVFIGAAGVLFSAALSLRILAAARSPAMNLFTPSLAQSIPLLAIVLILVVGGAGFFFIIKDRDDRLLRESEEQYRSVAENASEAIIIVQDGVFVYANKAAERMTFGGAAGLAGRGGDTIWPEDRELVRSNYLRRMAGESVPSKYDIRIIGPDGGPKWVNLSAAVIEWKGRPAVLSLQTDISELKRREQRIGRLLEEKELLLREVNHRVKNNLSVAVSLLSLQDGPRNVKGAAEILRDAQSRLRAMSELYDALNAKGAYGELPIGEYLSSLVDEILALFPRDVPVRKILEFEPITLDTGTLSTIGLLVNELLTNSLKHAFAGVSDPELRLSARMRNGRVELVCADNGPGFDRGAHGSAPGGFGMQVISMLAAQLGAEPSVSSERGTTWRFVFDPKADPSG